MTAGVDKMVKMWAVQRPGGLAAESTASAGKADAIKTEDSPSQAQETTQMDQTNS